MRNYGGCFVTVLKFLEMNLVFRITQKYKVNSNKIKIITTQPKGENVAFRAIKAPKCRFLFNAPNTALPFKLRSKH